MSGYFKPACIKPSGELGLSWPVLNERPVQSGHAATVLRPSLLPLRTACLDGCRSPLTFLTRYWRGTRAGIVRLGLLHGLYCLGCCWLLMSLLFVVGVMNPGWIAVLALITLVEKTRPPNWSINRWIGGAAISAGIAIFVVAALPLTI